VVRLNSEIHASIAIIIKRRGSHLPVVVDRHAGGYLRVDFRLKSAASRDQDSPCLVMFINQVIQSVAVNVHSVRGVMVSIDATRCVNDFIKSPRIILPSESSRGQAFGGVGYPRIIVRADLHGCEAA